MLVNSNTKLEIYNNMSNIFNMISIIFSRIGVGRLKSIGYTGADWLPSVWDLFRVYLI